MAKKREPMRLAKTNPAIFANRDMAFTVGTPDPATVAEMMAAMIEASHKAVYKAIQSGSPELRQLREVWCPCGKRVATMYLWRDARRYVHVPQHKARNATDGRFTLSIGPRIIGLDEDEGCWPSGPGLFVCRCGCGYLFSCHRPNLEGLENGVIYSKNTPGLDEVSPVEVGDVITGWSVPNAKVTLDVPGLHVLSLGVATRARVTE